jgi:hypothetical protein
MAAVVRARPWRLGFAIGGRRDPGPHRPRTSRTQHSCGLWRPSPAGPGGCAGDSAPAGPDTHPFPTPWPFESGGLVSFAERPVRLGSRPGRVVGRSLLFRGFAPAGRATAVNSEGGRGRCPIKASGCRGCGRGHPRRARGSLTVRCHRCGWPRRLPLGVGSPAAPWLSALRSG